MPPRLRTLRELPLFPLLLLPLLSAAVGPLGMEATVQTVLGDLKVRHYGRQGSPVAIALHGGTRADWVHHEWDDAAAALSSKGGAGFHVVLPDLHASPEVLNRILGGAHAIAAMGHGPVGNTRGSSFGGSSRRAQSLLSALQDVVRWANRGTEEVVAGRSNAPVISLLLGKSWGGTLAMEVAALRTSNVEQLVLVAPSLPRGTTRSTVNCLSALFYAKDDPMYKDSPKVKALLTRLALFHTEPDGGHRVLPAYTPHIVGFASTQSVQSARPLGKGGTQLAAAIEQAKAAAVASAKEAARAAIPGLHLPRSASRGGGGNHPASGRPAAAASGEVPAAAAGGRSRSDPNLGPEQSLPEAVELSWVWGLVLVPAFCGPILFMLLPLRRMISRAVEASQKNAVGVGAAGTEAGGGRESRGAPRQQVIGAVE